MEHKPTRRLIAIMTLVLFVLNILAVIIFFDNISITEHDLYPATLFVIEVIIIIMAFHHEHKPNKLLVFLLDFVFFRRTRAFFHHSKNENDNKKIFRLALLIHCVLLPFYLPAAFFSFELQCLISTTILYLLPIAVFTIYIYTHTLYSMYKIKQNDTMEKERIEQERREELGQWK